MQAPQVLLAMVVVANRMPLLLVGPALLLLVAALRWHPALDSALAHGPHSAVATLARLLLVMALVVLLALLVVALALPLLVAPLLVAALHWHSALGPALAQGLHPAVATLVALSLVVALVVLLALLVVALALLSLAVPALAVATVLARAHCLPTAPTL